MPDLSPQLKSLLRTEHHFCHLVEMDLNGIGVYLNDSGLQEIDYAGKAFLGNGLLLGIDAVRQTGDISVNKTNITFTAVDQSIIALIENNNQTNRPVKIYRAYFSEDLDLVGVVLLTWGAVTSSGVNSNQESAEITITIAGAFADWERAASIRTTDASQKRWHPNDDGFKYATQVKPALNWGGK